MSELLRICGNKKRSCRMSRRELQQLEYLIGAQASVYCNMPPRTFYAYVAAGLIPKHFIRTSSNTEKPVYKREELDQVFKPRPLMEKIIYLKRQEHKTSLTASKKRS